MDCAQIAVLEQQLLAVVDVVDALLLVEIFALMDVELLVLRLVD